MSASFKVFNPTTGITRKLSAGPDVEWEGVEKQLRTLFSLTPADALSVTYTDTDGDVITISTTAEFRELLASRASVKFVLNLGRPAVQSVDAHEEEHPSAEQADEEKTPEDVKAEDDWVLEQVPASESTAAGAPVTSSEVEQAVATPEESAPEETATDSKVEKTTLDDVTGSDESAYPSQNGPSDQRSVLEAAAGSAVDVSAEAQSSRRDKGKSKAEAEAEPHVERKEEAAQGGEQAGKQGESEEEFDFEKELEKAMEELLTTALPTALSLTEDIASRAQFAQFAPHPRHVYVRRVPVFRPAVFHPIHALHRFGSVGPFGQFGVPEFGRQYYRPAEAAGGACYGGCGRRTGGCGW